MNIGREDFIKTIDSIIETQEHSFTEDALKFYKSFKSITEDVKPQFTENGKRILVFLQNSDKELWKAKELADELQISSRSVSGSCRKLVTDGYVDKVSKDPVIYTLSSKGKEIIFNEEENV